MNPTLCNLPNEIIDPLTDDLDSIEMLADRLRRHAMARVNDDDPDELTQRDELAHVAGIRSLARELHRRVDQLRGANQREITMDLTDDEHRQLLAVAGEMKMDPSTAAAEIIHEELERRFRIA